MSRLRAFLVFTLVFVVAGCDDDPVSPMVRTVPIEELVDGSLDVVMNPSGIVPLSAEVQFQAVEPVDASLTILGGPDAEPLGWRSPAVASEHSLPVLGLLPSASNLVEVELTTESGVRAVDTLVISTEPLPDFLPEIEITARSPELMEPGWNLSTLVLKAQHNMPIIFDGRGNIRWYLDLTERGLGHYLPMERLSNGNLVAGFSDIIFEFDMLGNTVNGWSLAPNYFQHHDVVEKANGNFVAPTNNRALETIEDHIVEVDRSSGAIVREWDLREVLDVDRFVLIESERDWLHVNSVWYDESDGGLIVSARNQGVFKVSAENELLWILAPHKGWGRAGVNGDGHETSEFLLTAVDASGNPYPDAVQQGDERTEDFDWPWAQHAAMLLPNGNLLLLDNGFRRQFGAGPEYTRGVEYEIDEEARTVRQVWAYGRERGSSFYASFVSDIDFLSSTGNRLVMPGIVRTGDGSRAFVTEVASDGTVVFEAVLHLKNNFVDNDRPDFVYRSERLPIYPD